MIGVGGFQRYRHGPVRLDIAAPEHPICSGLPETILLDDDETYWPPTPMIDRVIVLARRRSRKKQQGDPRRRPPSRCSGATNWAAAAFSAACRATLKTFDNPLFRTFLLRGIAWAAGESPCRLDGWRKPKPTLSR